MRLRHEHKDAKLVVHMCPAPKSTRFFDQAVEQIFSERLTPRPGKIAVPMQPWWVKHATDGIYGKPIGMFREKNIVAR